MIIFLFFSPYTDIKTGKPGDLKGKTDAANKGFCLSGLHLTV